MGLGNPCCDLTTDGQCPSIFGLLLIVSPLVFPVCAFYVTIRVVLLDLPILFSLAHVNLPTFSMLLSQAEHSSREQMLLPWEVALL